mmetsp:Transcript_33949/g.86796  ORF Transcript_33949/g.86796 Transcript_33949/m.86796 type:complete len:326 (+) Transcript_33949:745-1722(+)
MCKCMAYVLTIDKHIGPVRRYRRMKQSSGGHWTSSDPYWQGQPPNRSVYSADGSLTFLQTPGFEHPMLSGEGGPPTMAWRWARGSCGRLGPPGTFLRMSLRGREFPTMMVWRHRATWGWVMDNCWAVAASFPLPPPGSDPEMEDDALPATIETQAYEARCFNLGLPRLPEPGGGEEEEDNPILSQLLAAIHGGEEEEVEEEDGDEVEAVEEAEDGGGGGDEAEQPAHVATPEEHDRSHAPGGGSTEELPQPARAEVNEASASTFEPVAAAGMDPVAASQWLEDFDARWDSMKRRFDRVMSASLVQIAASMSTPDVEENGLLVQQE